VWRLACAAEDKCFVDTAIRETELCSNVFKKHVHDKSFNASDPKDLKEACCSVDRLERCLQAAAFNAGCKEEVSVLVSSLINVARNLLGNVYKTKCKYYNCNSAGALSLSAVALLPLLALTILNQLRAL
ncbi:unnamed protein product, partial [Ixodes hexagonus]